MKIELLYFEGCPSYQTALNYLQEVLKEEKLGVHVEMVKIKSEVFITVDILPESGANSSAWVNMPEFSMSPLMKST